MIQELTIENVPYVDGAMQEGQSKFKWILNGERICGAANTDSNDGVLNRPSVQVSENAKVIDSNVKETVIKVNEIAGNVNRIQLALGQAGSSNVIDQVNSNTDRITALEGVDNVTDEKIKEVRDATQAIHVQVGDREVSDTTNRDLFEDIFWVKTELGSFPGFDINGNSNPDSTGSGVKYRVGQLSSSVSNNTTRIGILENAFAASDLGSLLGKINDIRTEIGREADATGLPIYTRLKEIESTDQNTAIEISAIKSKIGFDNPVGIAEQVDTLTQYYTELNNIILDPTTGLKTLVGGVVSDIGDVSKPGTLMFDVGELKKTTQSLEQVIGVDSTSGIRSQISGILTEIGTAAEPDSIKGALHAHTSTLSDISINVSSLSNKVGDASTGLTAAVATISGEIYGVSSSPDEFTKKGIKASLKEQIAQSASYVVKPGPLGDFEYSNGGWVKKTELKFDFEHTTTVEVSNATDTFPIMLSNTDFTVIQGGTIEPGHLAFTDSGLVRVTTLIELSVDTNERVFNVSITKTGVAPKNYELTEYVVNSSGKRVFGIDRLLDIKTGEQLQFGIKTGDGTSTGSVSAKITCVIVPA